MKDSCEVCGKKEPRFLIHLEGANLMACGSCAREGKIISSLDSMSPQDLSSRKYSAPPKALREEESAIEGYGSIIRRKIQEKGLKRGEVAKAINEMESYIEHIEKEQTLPPIKVLKKLEKFLGVKLIEKTSPSLDDSSFSNQNSKKDLTLADILDFQNNKKKKKDED
ncbi:MAG: multiprotein-bridging factor 1 family protein [Candidatus ainarchaeum sp.]|nr:multiprotein-bridging factor 1 family protein [Candidatus ainarchaeum sp.]